MTGDKAKKTARTKEGVRARIQAAALDCFREKGYKETTVAQIARRAGLSPAALYLHFPGKRELFDSLQRPDLDFPSPRAEERRRKILHAALKIFSEKGYDAATMDDVAQAVDLSKAALYGYFPGKEQLFAAVLENAPGFSDLETLAGGGLDGTIAPSDASRSQVEEAGAGAAEAFAGDPESVLRKVALDYLSMFRDPARLNLVRIILAEGGRNLTISATFVTSAVERGSAFLAEYLERLGFGPLEELQQAAQALIGMLFSWVVLHRVLVRPEQLARPERERPERGLERAEVEMAKRAVRLFLYGLGRPQRK